MKEVVAYEHKGRLYKSSSEACVQMLYDDMEELFRGVPYHRILADMCTNQYLRQQTLKILKEFEGEIDNE